MKSTPDRPRADAVSFLAVLLISSLLGLSACGVGDENPSARPTDRTSTGVSVDRPPASPAREPSGAREPGAVGSTRVDVAPPTPPPTQTQPPTRTAAPTAAQPPASAVAPPPPPPPAPTQAPVQTGTPTGAPPAVALPPAPTVTASESGTATAAEPGGMGTLGWVLLIGLVVALIVGSVIWRSRRKSAWDAEVVTLEADTRTATATRLPPILSAETTGQRALSWPPLRADLIDLVDRWNLLAQRAPDDPRRYRSMQIQSLLQDLVSAVDAENEALAGGRDWTLLRPRVNEAERALSAALADQLRPGPPAAEEPGPPTYQT
jgi:hypothetical protein